MKTGDTGKWDKDMRHKDEDAQRRKMMEKGKSRSAEAREKM
jgi:hypothetical protein